MSFRKWLLASPGNREHLTRGCLSTVVVVGFCLLPAIKKRLWITNRWRSKHLAIEKRILTFKFRSLNSCDTHMMETNPPPYEFNSTLDTVLQPFCVSSVFLFGCLQGKRNDDLGGAHFWLTHSKRNTRKVFCFTWEVSQTVRPVFLQFYSVYSLFQSLIWRPWFNR